MVFNWQCSYTKRLRLDHSPRSPQANEKLPLRKDDSKCHQKSPAVYQSVEARGSHALFSLLLPLRKQEEQYV